MAALGTHIDGILGQFLTFELTCPRYPSLKSLKVKPAFDVISDGIIYVPPMKADRHYKQ